MATFNRAFVLGRLGKTPEVKYSQSGNAVTSLSVATNEAWTDKDGEKHESTEWHKVTVFGKNAENCGKYLTKGSLVFVEGKLQTSQWEDANGIKKSQTQIIASTVRYLSRSDTKEEYQQPETDSEVPF